LRCRRFFLLDIVCQALTTPKIRTSSVAAGHDEDAVEQTVSRASLPLEVMIADDHAIFRAGLRLALEVYGGIATVREAATLYEVISSDALGRIGILLLDLQIPGFSTLDDLTGMRRRLGTTPILILSASDKVSDMVGCLAAGASGYVTKGSDIRILLDAIKLVCAGGIYVPTNVIHDAAVTATVKEGNAFPRLTRRQDQVLDLALDGHANKEIGYRLDISEGTVKAHLSAIMRSYNVGNRIQLMREVGLAGQR
jgi:DNA-binding NarL/FixJ family response regulator